MPRPLPRIAIRILARRARRSSPRSVSLYLIRKQAEVGLFRDGGMTALEVCRYVRDLRGEVVQEISLRRRKH